MEDAIKKEKLGEVTDIIDPVFVMTGNGSGESAFSQEDLNRYFDERGLHVFGFARFVIQYYVNSTELYISTGYDNGVVDSEDVWSIISNQTKFIIDELIPMLVELGDSRGEKFYASSGIALFTTSVQSANESVAAWCEAVRVLMTDPETSMTSTMREIVKGLCLEPLNSSVALIRAMNESVHPNLYQED